MEVDIPDLGDHYAMGETVKITGDGHRIVVGGLRYFYVLELNDDDDWVRVGERISGVENWDRLGTEVAISEDTKTIIAGGWLWSEVQGDTIGMARVFRESNGHW